jgi:hypothetical protein
LTHKSEIPPEVNWWHTDAWKVLFNPHLELDRKKQVVKFEEYTELDIYDKEKMKKVLAHTSSFRRFCKYCLYQCDKGFL